MTIKVLIIAEHASLEFGGEAALPLHYYRVLRQRGHKVWLIVHERTRDELTKRFGSDASIEYVPDTPVVRALWRFSRFLPQRISSFTVGYLMRLLTQRKQTVLARNLVAREAIDIVHSPMPVSPREPSLLYNLGAPVIIGPMNGGMNYPPGFRARDQQFEKNFIKAGRAMSNLMNRVFPGKRHAQALLVANERTRLALPSGITGEVIKVVENGVDLKVWKTSTPTNLQNEQSNHVRFIFMGRLIPLKGVDLLLQAFQTASQKIPMSLFIIGEGPERQPLEKLAISKKLLSQKQAAGKVTFAGWQSQEDCAHHLASSDVLLLPSLMECGGAVVLEAMAMARPVIATDWGGPQDYLDPSCGILVPPTTPETFAQGFEAAMLKLAGSKPLREKMGKAATKKNRNDFRLGCQSRQYVGNLRPFQKDRIRQQPHIVSDENNLTPITKC